MYVYSCLLLHKNHLKNPIQGATMAFKWHLEAEGQECQDISVRQSYFFGPGGPESDLRNKPPGLTLQQRRDLALGPWPDLNIVHCA